MKKKNIAFILFGVAGLNMVTLPILLLIYGQIYERAGIPSNLTNIIFLTMTVITLTIGSIMILAGIIVYFKFRRE
jgi:hypothetical protein